MGYTTSGRASLSSRGDGLISTCVNAAELFSRYLIISLDRVGYTMYTKVMLKNTEAKTWTAVRGDMLVLASAIKKHNCRNAVPCDTGSNLFYMCKTWGLHVVGTTLPVESLRNG